MDLVVALPVRNSAALLPAWFEAVTTFADGVVALDDGSTDETAALLEEHPLTRVLLRNPPRPGFAGWDDAANRQRLVDACAALRPRWILQVDADEELAPGDGPALRRAIAHGALDPTCGYLLRVVRMIDPTDLPGRAEPDLGDGTGDEPGPGWYDQDHTWVGRLFAWRPGIRLPSQRLHLVPLPVDIDADRWVRTTLRLCHHGSRDIHRRHARLAKYREVDPDEVWETDYDRLVRHPGPLRRLESRPPSLPVVPNAPWPGERQDAAGHPVGEPLVTAVVIGRGDHEAVEDAVGAVVAQEVSASVQVVVVVSDQVTTAPRIRRRFPEVEVVELSDPALPGAARNAGLARARGRYVTFPGSHVRLLPGSLEARLQAHLDGWGMVTGTSYNGTRTPAGWASYFLDHSGGLPDRPSHPMTVAPSHSSYLTAALRQVGGFPEDMRTAEDTMVNTELFALGYGAWRARRATMVHVSPCRDLRTLVRHHYRRGLGHGTMILLRHPPEAGPVLTRSRVVNLGFRYLPGRLHRIHHYTWRYGGPLRVRWVLVSPLAMAGVVAAWLGTWRELLRARPGRRDLLVADRLTPGSLWDRATGAARRHRARGRPSRRWSKA